MFETNDIRSAGHLTPAECADGPWNVLPYLLPERRGDDPRRGVRRGRYAITNDLLFGPFWPLPAGGYRLSLNCRPAYAQARDQALIGLEIIAQNRHLIAWRDFTPAELAQCPHLDFQVPPEWGAEQSGVGLEFRFSYLGGDGVDLAGVTLSRLDGVVVQPRKRWRLMAQLKPFLFGCLTAARQRSGTAILPSGLPLPSLRTRRLVIPTGRFELRVVAETARSAPEDRELLTVRLAVWRGAQIFKRTIKAADLVSGCATLTIDLGSDVPGAEVTYPVILEIYVHTRRILLRDVELVRISDPPAQAAAPRRSSAGRRGARKIVALGNCQVETLVAAIEKSPHLARRFRARFYRPFPSPDLLEAARRDLAECDVVLIQDIAEVTSSALTADIPASAQIVHVPCLHFASLWPFDGYNGPTDFLAQEREKSNLTFCTLDGLLGRLRDEMPEPASRFSAYADLALPGIVDVQRLHRFEERRLLKMDQRYGFRIGAYILKNFRSRRLFHTTAHPNRALFNMLLRHVTGQLGKPVGTLWRGLNHLSRDQTPVHPLIARKLGVRWANERTGYLHRGRKVTWAQYIRAYIDHYG